MISIWTVATVFESGKIIKHYYTNLAAGKQAWLRAVNASIASGGEIFLHESHVFDSLEEEKIHRTENQMTLEDFILKQKFFLWALELEMLGCSQSEYRQKCLAKSN